MNITLTPTDTSSEMYFVLDAELHKIRDYLTKHEVDCSEVVSYWIHYEPETPEALTKKLQSIMSLNDIKASMFSTDPGWKIDWDVEIFYGKYTQ